MPETLHPSGSMAVVNLKPCRRGAPAFQGPGGQKPVRKLRQRKPRWTAIVTLLLAKMTQAICR